MSLKRYALAQLAMIAIAVVSLPAQSNQAVPLLSIDNLGLRNVKAEAVNYKGRPAIRIIDVGALGLDDAGRLALVRGTSFTNGTIEIDLSGDTAPDAAENLRGFVGIGFRVANDASRFECFYLRPRNGRSQDQLQRNHSAWQKLRAETPGRYESYVDLLPGEWTKVKIVVSGEKAQLYVNGAAQPTLIVNDLKQSLASGAVALWIGPGTIAHFANLKIAP